MTRFVSWSRCRVPRLARTQASRLTGAGALWLALATLARRTSRERPGRSRGSKRAPRARVALVGTPSRGRPRLATPACRQARAQGDRGATAIAQYRPHVILLMIGTNDDLNIDGAGAPARLGALVDRITAAAPDSLLTVAQIIPTTNAASDARVRAYDAAIPAVIEARQRAPESTSSERH